jgi:predicted nuclease of predicted toxin-antitoxin system
MRFLVDECAGPSVASWLRVQNHDVFSVFDEARGMDDDGIITKTLHENRILVTNDKGFGDKIYRDGRLHKGVILLRLEDERPASKIRVLSSLLEKYSSRISDSFLVATERQVRFAKSDQQNGPQSSKEEL